jgi:hypothetical protein
MDIYYTKQLQEALVKFSNGKLPEGDAQKIAEIAVRNVDIDNNAALQHKGLNWFAKYLLSRIKNFKDEIDPMKPNRNILENSYISRIHDKK